MIADLRDLDQDSLINCISTLKRQDIDLAQKYQSLFALRNAKNPEATLALIQALFHDQSNLFRHDVAFCLGQKQDMQAIRVLVEILKAEKEHYMVRHEAAEALAAIGTKDSLEAIRQHLDDSCEEVRDTCQLAIKKLQYDNSKQQIKRNLQGDFQNLSYEENKYNSIDPTPAYSTKCKTELLEKILMDDLEDIFQRYNALFALRNKGDQESIAAICRCLHTSKNTLLKHEVAYVLGQVQSLDTIPALCSSLSNTSENAMVRHEAAEALGAISNEQCVKILQEFMKDQEPIVADSCAVALDEILQHS